MKYLKNVFPLLLTIIGLSSCSPQLSPFTQKLYEENDWTENDLKRIQFYLSEDISLQRQASRGVSEITRGEIKIIDGKKVEEIVIRKGTPGVFLFQPKDNRFAVSFEEGDEERFLVFGPSEKYGGKYSLRAKEWNNRRGGGSITYDGKNYYTPSKSAFAILMVDLKKVRNVSVKSRTAGGRKVDQ